MGAAAHPRFAPPPLDQAERQFVLERRDRNAARLGRGAARSSTKSASSTLAPILLRKVKEIRRNGDFLTRWGAVNIVRPAFGGG
jgi:hypothetical protein